jgi:hypothetical protein
MDGSPYAASARGGVSGMCMPPCTRCAICTRSLSSAARQVVGWTRGRRTGPEMRQEGPLQTLHVQVTLQSARRAQCATVCLQRLISGRLAVNAMTWRHRDGPNDGRNLGKLTIKDPSAAGLCLAAGPSVCAAGPAVCAAGPAVCAAGPSVCRVRASQFAECMLLKVIRKHPCKISKPSYFLQCQCILDAVHLQRICSMSDTISYLIQFI